MKRWILYILTFLGIGAVLAAIAVPGMVVS
jgi:hypothetical protein